MRSPCLWSPCRASSWDAPETACWAAALPAAVKPGCAGFAFEGVVPSARGLFVASRLPCWEPAGADGFAPGLKALGLKALGLEALGLEALGPEALGPEALGL